MKLEDLPEWPSKCANLSPTKLSILLIMALDSRLKLACKLLEHESGYGTESPETRNFLIKMKTERSANG